MGLFKFFSKKRAAAIGFQPQKSVQKTSLQTFILEPILTPSGLLDGGDSAPDPVVMDWNMDTLPDVDLPDMDVDADARDAIANFDLPDADADATDALADVELPDADGQTDARETFAASSYQVEISDADIEPVDFFYGDKDDSLTAIAESSSTIGSVDLPDTDALANVDLLGSVGDTGADTDAIANVDLPDTDGDTDPNAIANGDLSDIDASTDATDASVDVDLSDTDATGADADTEIPDDGIEAVDFVYKDAENPVTDVIQPSPTFNSGVFTVGETGEVSIDFLFDGGQYQGELAVFSLDGMDGFEPGSEEFIKEAASRALSNSELGHIAISDTTEGARFSGALPHEGNFNTGAYQGVKTFSMRPGDTFGVMLVPHGTLQQLYDNPAAEGYGRPLFSMTTSKPTDAFHMGQIADVTGDGNTFVMEDMGVDGWTDKDYNDVIFQVRGATGKAALLDDVIDSGKDWRSTDMGEALIAYAKPYITPDAVDDGGAIAVNPIINNSGIPTDPVDDGGGIATDPVTDNSDIATDPVDGSSVPIEDSTENLTDDVTVVEEPTNAGEVPVRNTVQPQRFEFVKADQPLVGVIDSSIGANNPDLDYSRIILGQDRVDGDANPLLPLGEGNDSDTDVLEIIGATQNNGIGIDGVNDDAPLWVGRANGSDQWAESLMEFVDAAKQSSQPNAVVNLSFDLTQVNPDGSVTTRYEFTPSERAALAYAQRNNVLLVVAAGDNPGQMSALGKASLEFDNIITVGAAERVNNSVALSKAFDLADYSGSGTSLDILADGSSGETVGTSVATAKVTGAVSQVWAANPELNYTQVIDIIKRTAIDLGKPNWDLQTGAGLLNIAAAVHLAKATRPEPYTVKPGQQTITDNFISQTSADKTLPGDPTHPAIAPPGIPQTTVDQGANDLSGTRIRISATEDVIDQVSGIDPTDVYRGATRELAGAKFEVLTGQAVVSILSPSGQVLSQQVLSRGTHNLQMPANAPEEVLLKIDTNGTGATYVLQGFEAERNEPFDISLEFESPLTASQQQVMQAAARSVASLIGKGLPSAVVDGKIIDDINIKISTANLDGAGGTQARTKIDFMRYGSLLPAQSLVQFDGVDIEQLERSGNLFDVAQHEFLHALGFGNLWEAKGLVNYAGTPLAQYNGKNAVEEFQKAGGLMDTIALETEGNGSASLHWHQQLFPNEIMTADLNGFTGEPAPISAVTIASLADLGYVVNLDRATPDYQLFGSQAFDAEDLTPEQIEAFRQLAEMSFEDSDADYEYIAPIMPTVDPDKISPEIWAHAERFWKNNEYYDWVRHQIRPNEFISHITQRTMGNGIDPDYWAFVGNKNGLANVHRIAAGDWIWIPDHRPNYEWEQEQERLRREEELRRRQEEEARIRREQEEAFAREQERIRLEEEARRREAEAKQRELEEQERRLREEMERRRQEEERRLEEARLAELARQAEIARQQGKGGLDWYIAKPLPEFGPVDPFETRLTGETVGNLVPDDYYRFTLSRGGRITAELRQLLADADLVLYDVRNRPIAYSMREGITDEHLIADLIPGTYMLRVNSPKGVTTDYELVVQFKHKLSQSELGLPGWNPGGSGGNGGSGGAPGSLFGDSRIQRIYDTALSNFAGQERAKANARIAELQREKRSYEQEMQVLLDKMNAEQRAKVHKALDDARHNANVWVDNIANPIKNTVDSLADGIINKANSVADGLLSTVNNIWDFGNGWIKDRKEDARKLIRQGQDAVKSAVNNARSWLKAELGKIQDAVKSAVWHFFETIKNAYRTGAEINQIIANAANAFRSAIDEAVRGTNELVGKFKGQVLSAVDWTKNLGIKVDNFGVKFEFNVYNQVVKPAVDAISGGVSSTINGIGNSLKGITDWLEPRTQKVVADVVNALFGDQTGHLWNKIHGVDAKIAATRTELERKIANKARELQSQLNDFVNKLGSDGKKLLDTLLNFSNSPTAQIGMAVVEVLLGLIPGVGQAIDIKDTARSLYDILIQGKRGVGDFVGLIGALAGWVPGVGDAIKSVAKVAMRGVDFLVPVLKNLGPDLTETVIKTASELDWGKILTDVVDTVVRRWDDIVRVLNNSADWILDLLGAKPVMATAGGVILKFRGAANDVAGSISPQASEFLINKVKDARKEIFNGILRGVKVELPDILIKRITISKVPDSVRLSLRNAFDNSVRKDFAKSLASDSNKLDALRKAGLNDADILRLSNGGIPTGWQVHHKLPLEFGGSNSFDNLVLIKNDPYHMVLTNAQKDLSKQLSEGDELLVDWPSPNGFIYPLSSY